MKYKNNRTVNIGEHAVAITEDGRTLAGVVEQIEPGEGEARLKLSTSNYWVQTALRADDTWNGFHDVEPATNADGGSNDKLTDRRGE